MSLGLPNHNLDPDRQFTFFPGIRVWSSHTVRNSDVVIASHFNDQNDKGGQWSVTSSRAEALDEKRLQAQQHIELHQAPNLEGLQEEG